MVLRCLKQMKEVVVPVWARARGLTFDEAVTMVETTTIDRNNGSNIGRSDGKKRRKPKKNRKSIFRSKTLA